MKPAAFIIPWLACLCVQLHAATTIDNTNRSAWAANLGWVNCQGNITQGAVVGEYILSGYIWTANAGWINFGDGTPMDGIAYSGATTADYGVNVLPGQGSKAELRGFAYGANIGWINFEATGNPQLDRTTGAFSGYAWSANCGWLNLGELGLVLETDSIQPGTDSDLDGIADAFELVHFQNLTTGNQTSDSDGDGESDSSEYAADTDPRDPDSGLKITAFSTAPDLTHSTLTWTSRFTRSYRIFTAETLPGPWQLILDSIVPTTALTTRSVPNVPPTDRRFFRVQAFSPLLPP